MLDDKWHKASYVCPNYKYVVVEFYHDRAGTTTEKIYIPDTDASNAVIDTWAGHGLTCIMRTKSKNTAGW